MNFTPHIFGETKTDQVTQKLFKQCIYCNKVHFLEGDDFFNLNCMSRFNDLEDTRERLENTK